LAGQDPDRIPYDANSYLGEQVHQSFQQSCLNLHTDHVDCLILHSPLKTLALTMEAWKAMEAIHDAGGARQLGISNCYDQTFLDALHAETTVKPAIIQNRFFQQTDYDADLRQRCQDLGVLYESFWTLTANPHILGHREVRKIAEKRQKSEAQILFRYLTQLGIVPLTGTTSAKHMQEDLAIFEFDLNDEERQSVDLLLSSQLP
jgi:diketogulonate reductase-like aldo/keto reductase